MKYRVNLTAKKNGFTLVEVLVVISILSILSTITIIGYTSFMNKAAVSNDTSLANQVNKLLEGHRITEEITSYDSISEMLNNNIDFEIDIQTKDINMNIYYNDDNEQFELMDNNEMYYTLEEIMNWEDEQIKNPQDEDSILNTENPPMLINIDIHKEYYAYKDTKLSYSNNSQKIEALINEYEQLDISMYINENKELITPCINISEIITITDTSDNELKLRYIYENSIQKIICQDSLGNELELICELIEIDIVEHFKEHDKNENFEFSKDGLKIYTPGVYKIRFSNGEGIFDVDVIVKNIYWDNIPQIITSDDLQYKTDFITNDDGTINLKIYENNWLSKITINDIIAVNQINPAYPTKLSEIKSYISDIYLIIDINNIEITIPMNKIVEKDNNHYLIIESLDIDSIDNINIEIKYQYQSLNGQYVYNND